MSPKFLRGIRRREPARTPVWPASSGRKRVLVENDAFAELHVIERILTDEGYEVITCAGPSSQERRACPLVEGDGCALVGDADLVVHGLRITEPENEAVLRAIRDQYRDTPVVVEVPMPQLEQLRTTLEGCRVITFPTTRNVLVDAVHDLLAAG